MSNNIIKQKDQKSFFDIQTDDGSLNHIRFVDLFAGLGGTRLGLEMACENVGLSTECILTSEIKKHAIKALKNNHEQETLKGDIRAISTDEIGDFDILLGGFPCQAFSTAGKGLGFLDTRGTLFFEIERILLEKKPYGFILENVEGLVSHDKEKPNDKIGRTLKTILAALAKLEYKVTWTVLDSQYYGVPQTRKRIYIVGTRDREVLLDIPQLPKVNFGDICEKGLPLLHSHFTKCLLKNYKPSELYGKAIKDKRGGEQNIHSWDIGLKGEVTDAQKKLINKLFKERRKRHWAEKIGIPWMDGMPLTLDQISTFCNAPNLFAMLEDLVSKGYLVKEYPKTIKKIMHESGVEHDVRVQDETKAVGYNIVAGKLSFEFTKILDINDVSPTLVAMDVSKLGVVDGNGIRRLSLREGLRLFGYPETYSLDYLKTKKEIAEGFDLLGNTVTVPVIKAIADKLMAAYIETKLKI